MIDVNARVNNPYSKCNVPDKRIADRVYLFHETALYYKKACERDPEVSPHRVNSDLGIMSTRQEL